MLFLNEYEITYYFFFPPRNYFTFRKGVPLLFEKHILYLRNVFSLKSLFLLMFVVVVFQ